MNGHPSPPKSGRGLARAAPSDRIDSGVTFSLSAIGVVHSPFAAGGPIPKHFERSGVGTVEVFPEFVSGLKGVEGIRDLWLLTYRGPWSTVGRATGRAGKTPCEGSPARSPRDLGRLMLTLVRLLDARGGVLRVEGLDLDDGTPLLDIKPYMAHRDRPRET